MKTKLLSVIAGLALSVTAFAALSATAGAATYNAADLMEGDVLEKGDVITASNGTMAVWRTWRTSLSPNYEDQLSAPVTSYTLPDTNPTYMIKSISRSNDTYYKRPDTAANISMGSSGYFAISIEQIVLMLDSVSFNASELYLKVGETGSLNVTYDPAKATYKDLRWTSSDTAVATVENGTVTAKAAGTATITAESTKYSGIKASCTVYVNESLTNKEFVIGDTVNFGGAYVKTYDDDYNPQTVQCSYYNAKIEELMSGGSGGITHAYFNDIVKNSDGSLIDLGVAYPQNGCNGVKGFKVSGDGTEASPYEFELIFAGDVSRLKVGDIIPHNSNMLNETGKSYKVMYSDGTVMLNPGEILSKTTTITKCVVTKIEGNDTDGYVITIEEALAGSGTAESPYEVSTYDELIKTLEDECYRNKTAEGTYIKLMQDIHLDPGAAVEYNTVLDLNGHKITCSSNEHILFVGKGASLTVNNSSGAGSIEKIWVLGTLNFNGGSADMISMNDKGASVIINGGSVGCLYGSTAESYGGKAEIKGGYIGELNLNTNTQTEQLTINISGGSFGEDPTTENQSVVTIADGMTVTRSGEGENQIFVVAYPISAVYELVNDYTAAEAETDKAASLWKVTVSAKGRTVSTLNVKVNGHSPKDGKDIKGNFTNAQVVFGVVVNAPSTRVENMTAIVNGDEIQATVK